MDATKQSYLNEIRNNTAYPTYRGIIGLIAMLLYVMAVLYGLGSLIGGLGMMRNSFLGGLGMILMGLVAAALTFLLARFWKEAALILADIGDSITDANARK
jgi:hypothetical protein